MSKLYCRGSAVFFLIALINAMSESLTSAPQLSTNPVTTTILSPSINNTFVDVDVEVKRNQDNWAKSAHFCCQFLKKFSATEIFGVSTITKETKEGSKRYIRLKLLANDYFGRCCEECYNTVKNAEEYLKKIDPDQENSPLTNKDTEDSHLNLFRIEGIPYLLCKNSFNEYYLFPAVEGESIAGEYRLEAIENKPCKPFMKFIFSEMKHESYSFSCLDNNKDFAEARKFTILTANKNYGKNGKDINFRNQTSSSFIGNITDKFIQGLSPSPSPAPTTEQTVDKANPIPEETAKKTSSTAEQMTGQAKDVAKQMTGQVKDVAKQMTGQAKDVAKKMTGQTKKIAKKITGKTEDTAKKTESVSEGAQNLLLK